MVGPDLVNKPKEKNDGYFGKDREKKKKNQSIILPLNSGCKII